MASSFSLLSLLIRLKQAGNFCISIARCTKMAGTGLERLNETTFEGLDPKFPSLTARKSSDVTGGIMAASQQRYPR